MASYNLTKLKEYEDAIIKASGTLKSAKAAFAVALLNLHDRDYLWTNKEVNPQGLGFIAWAETRPHWGMDYKSSALRYYVNIAQKCKTWGLNTRTVIETVPMAASREIFTLADKYESQAKQILESTVAKKLPLPTVKKMTQKVRDTGKVPHVIIRMSSKSLTFTNTQRETYDRIIDKLSAQYPHMTESQLVIEALTFWADGV